MGPKKEEEINLGKPSRYRNSRTTRSFKISTVTRLYTTLHLNTKTRLPPILLPSFYCFEIFFDLTTSISRNKNKGYV